MRSILIIGGTGFLGANLALWLQNQGHRVLVTGNHSEALVGMNFVRVPLKDVDAISDLVRNEKVDTVVQMACTLRPANDYNDYAKECVEINLPMYRLASKLARNSIRFVFMSSGGTIYGAQKCEPIGEYAACEPINVYGQAKLEAESHLRFLARVTGLHLLILRPSNPYGLHQDPTTKQGLVSVAFDKAARGQPLDIWGNGETVRDYIFVEDAVQSIGELILLGAEGTFNIGSGVGTSVLDVVRTVERVTGRSITLNFHAARRVDAPRIILDVSRLSSLGLYFARPLEAGIRKFAEQLELIDVK